MLYYLSFPLSASYSGFNVFRYITFRAAMAALLALLISFLLGPWLIRTLTQKQIGQQIREDGPATHAIKAGTPTMGGALIILALLLSTLIMADIANGYVLLALVATVGTGGDPSHAPARRAYETAGFGPAIPSLTLYRLL